MIVKLKVHELLASVKKGNKHSFKIPPRSLFTCITGKQSSIKLSTGRRKQRIILGRQKLHPSIPVPRMSVRAVSRPALNFYKTEERKGK